MCIMCSCMYDAYHVVFGICRLCLVVLCELC